MQREIPMIMLLLDRHRNVSDEEVRGVVQAELGDDAARATCVFGENSAGMSYFGWRHGKTNYHLGTSSRPYTAAAREERVDSEGKLANPPRLTIHELVPPEDEKLRGAWMLHTAFLYVDALPYRAPPDEDGLHRRRVFRVASHFVDERCVLLWRWGRELNRFALPSPQAITALRAGEWPI